jgi:hypothetical protein
METKVMEYPFKIQVLVYTRPNLRDEGLSAEMYLGYGVLESLFDKMEIRKDIIDVFLSFPERWLNIIECRQLFKRLQKYCPNLKFVKIKTHSPIIMSSIENNKDAFLMDETMNNNDNLEEHLYHKESIGDFNMNAINVIGSNK